MVLCAHQFEQRFVERWRHLESYNKVINMAIKTKIAVHFAIVPKEMEKNGITPLWAMAFFREHNYASEESHGPEKLVLVERLGRKYMLETKS